MNAGYVISYNFCVGYMFQIISLLKVHVLFDIGDILLIRLVDLFILVNFLSSLLDE